MAGEAAALADEALLFEPREGGADLAGRRDGDDAVQRHQLVAEVVHRRLVAALRTLHPPPPPQSNNNTISKRRGH